MSTFFVPCPQCKRHVLASETDCPFCRSVLPADLGLPRRPAPVATGPFARAAIVFMGAATTACSSSNPTGEPMPVVFYGPAVVVDGSMQGDSGEPVPVVFYGPAIVDASLEKDTGPSGSGADGSSAGADAGPPADASTGADAGPPVPFYGPAIVDSGSER